MSWQISEPPKADANSFAARDWLYQIWKFITFNSNITIVSADYNARMEDKYILMSAASGAKNIVLPFATGNSGKEIIIKKTEGSGNSVTATARGTETIDGSASVSTSVRGTPIRLVSDNSNWILW
jgi:hypothetical protein